MPTTKDRHSFWSGQIPYKTNGGQTEKDFVKHQLDHLNLMIGKPLFVEQQNQADYILYKPSNSLSHSYIGKKGGEQVVTYPESNPTGKPETFKESVFQHETMHSIGYGHEEYHTKSPLRGPLLNATDEKGNPTMRSELFKMEIKGYKDKGQYNDGSVMQYNPTVRFEGATTDHFEAYQQALKNGGFRKEFTEGALLNPGDLNAIRASVGPEVPEFDKAQPGGWYIGKVTAVHENSALQQVGDKVYLHENVQGLEVGSNRSIQYDDKDEAKVSDPPEFQQPQQGGWYNGKIIAVDGNSALQQVGNKVYLHQNVQDRMSADHGTNLEVGSNLSIRYGIGMETKVVAPQKTKLVAPPHNERSRSRGFGF